LLKTLPPAEQRRFLAACRRRRFSRGEVLFHEGDVADSVHVLTEGRAAVGITTANGDVATLTVVGPGATFGDVALLAHPPIRSATVTALEPCLTLSLQGPAFEALRREHPAVERLLLEALAGEVRRLTAQLVEALYVPADRRVLRRLLDLTSLYDDGDAQPSIPVTQAMLASMAGTSRVTANQVLSRARDRGCLRLTRGRIQILDRRALARLAG
jgi:CRP-like cAMP-binding protein